MKYVWGVIGSGYGETTNKINPGQDGCGYLSGRDGREWDVDLLLDRAGAHVGHGLRAVVGVPGAGKIEKKKKSIRQCDEKTGERRAR